MKGWRWIGIITSVIWFFGFGVLFWNEYVEEAVAPYAQDLKICSAIEQYSDEFWQANARDSEELSEKLQVNQDQYEKCASKAKLQWESERPSDELSRNLGDDERLKAAYRGGCRACQNLPKGAIRHVERYHCHPVASA